MKITFSKIHYTRNFSLLYPNDRANLILKVVQLRKAPHPQALCLNKFIRFRVLAH